MTWVDTVLFEEIRSGDPFALAIANLRARTTQPLRRKAITPERNACFVGEDDGLDSGRLLLHDLWAPLKSNVARDMECVDRVAGQIGDRMARRGVPTLMPFWLIWTEQGWGEAEI